MLGMLLVSEYKYWVQTSKAIPISVINVEACFSVLLFYKIAHYICKECK